MADKEICLDNEILRFLYAHDGYLSGEEISQTLGITRAAVAKRIAKLREEGYPISAVTNRGYRLEDKSLKACYGWELQKAFAGMESSLWRELRFEDTVDSTNLLAKRLIASSSENPEGIVVTCELQTAGRGRRGRSWEVPAGSGIAMSPILCPKIPASRAPMLTLVAGMAVRKALEDLYDVHAVIKWPNDIVVDGKKICGILTEMSMEDLDMTGLAVGIGINVQQTAFDEEIAYKATSVALVTGISKPDRAALFTAVLRCLEDYYRRFMQTTDLSLLQDEYHAHCVNVGRMVHVMENPADPDSGYSACATGITRYGDLRLRKADGSETVVSSGEVSVRGVYGYAE